MLEPRERTAAGYSERGRSRSPLASWPRGAGVCRGTHCSTANCHRTGHRSSSRGGGWMRCVKREPSLDQSRKAVSQSRSCFLLFSFLTHPLSLSLTVILPALALAEEERQVCGREARASALSAEAGHGQGAGKCQLRWLLQMELGAKEKQVLWHCRSFQRGHHQDCLA